MTQKNKTIVVTGGYGFIGSRFIKCVYDNTDYNIINIDKHTYAADTSRVPAEIRGSSRYTVYKLCIAADVNNNLDSTTRERLLSADYVVNFAAESHVDNSIEDGSPFVRSNIDGVFNLLNFFRQSDRFVSRGKFVQISTDEVYGDMRDLMGEPSATESFNLRPSSYYSATKASADLLVQSAARTFGINYLITRSCNNFGPNQDPEKFIPKVFESIKNEKSVPVYGDGRQRREWIHVDDNVRYILQLVESDFRNETFNIGSGYSYRNIDILNMIGDIWGKPVKYKYVKDRLGHDVAYRLDCSKLHKSFQDSEHSVCTTLEEFLELELENAIARL